MAWVTIAEARSLDEFRLATPSIAELPKWTNIKLRIELPWWAPVGNLLEIAPKSWWVDKLTPEGIVVTDVKGGWYWLEVYGLIDPPHPSLLVISVFITAIALLAFGISALIKSIKLSADLQIPEPSFDWKIIALAIGIVAVLIAFRKPIIEAIPSRKKEVKA